MKLNETIKLNDKEYTVELNRESMLKINQYTNLKEIAKEINEPLYEDKSKIEISENENPFEDSLSQDEIEKIAKEKIEMLKNTFVRAFWIWLYPVEKMSIKQVGEILEPYFEDEEKLNFLSLKFQEFSEKSIGVMKEDQEAKNLETLAK